MKIMKKVIPYMLTGIILYSCASSIKLINGDLKFSRSMNVPNRGLTHYLRFVDKKDNTNIYSIPLLGSEEELDSLLEETRGKSLSLDESLYREGKGWTLDEIRELIVFNSDL